MNHNKNDHCKPTCARSHSEINKSFANNSLKLELNLLNVYGIKKKFVNVKLNAKVMLSKQY